MLPRIEYTITGKGPRAVSITGMLPKVGHALQRGMEKPAHDAFIQPLATYQPQPPKWPGTQPHH